MSGTRKSLSDVRKSFSVRPAKSTDEDEDEPEDDDKRLSEAQLKKENQPRTKVQK